MDGGGVVNRSDVRFVKGIVIVALLVLMWIAVVGTNDAVRNWLEPGPVTVAPYTNEQWKQSCDEIMADADIYCYWGIGRNITIP